MSFRYEAEMATPAVRWLESHNLFVKREYSLPWGVCDLVALSFREDRVAERLQLGQREPIGPAIRVRLLSEIPDREQGRSISFKTLRDRFTAACDTDRVAVEVAVLKERGFIVEPRSGYLQRVNGWAPLHHRIVAIELKLRRVSEAIRQAEAHTRFTDESYLGLPAEFAEEVVRKQSAQLTSRGVGVLSISKNAVHIGHPASSSSIDPVLQMYCAEKFWRVRSQALEH